MDENEPIQGVFDFETGNADGFANWRREQELRLEAVRREWSVPVGRMVRLKLHDIDGEFEGRLRLVHHPAVLDRRAPLHLRLDRMEFTRADVEYCVAL